MIRDSSQSKQHTRVRVRTEVHTLNSTTLKVCLHLWCEVSTHHTRPSSVYVYIRQKWDRGRTQQPTKSRLRNKAQRLLFRGNNKGCCRAENESFFENHTHLSYHIPLHIKYCSRPKMPSVFGPSWVALAHELSRSLFARRRLDL